MMTATEVDVWTTIHEDFQQLQHLLHQLKQAAMPIASSDIEAMQGAATMFQEKLIKPPPAQEAAMRTLRHDLRNDLNVLNGFCYMAMHHPLTALTSQQAGLLYLIHAHIKGLQTRVDAL